MACRTRWGGLEQEGFGIVFVEAAACGVPQVAGDSGGAAEAVDDGVTGVVVRHPEDPGELATALEGLLDDPARRADMGQASRKRAVAEFSYDVLAERLGRSLGVGELSESSSERTRGRGEPSESSSERTKGRGEPTKGPG
jgi:phosphatidylinositol alpha-1,6-mannosyltransferase